MRGLAALIVFVMFFLFFASSMGIPAVAQQVDCPGAPPTRLSIGVRARVTKTPPGQTPSPVRVRDVPGKAGKVIDQLPDLAEFDIAHGPACADGYLWWGFIEFKKSPTGIGWVAEGDKDGYFIEPVVSATAIPNQSAVTPTHDPAIDKPGAKIVFVKGEFMTANQPHQLFMMNSDGTNQIAITSAQYDSDHPAWLPDGKHLSYVQNRDTIVVMNPDGTNPVQIVSDPPNSVIYSLYWSRSGKRVAFQEKTPTAPGSFNYVDSFSIVNADGSGRVTLNENAERISWSPTDSRLVYSTYKDSEKLFVLNVEKSESTELTEGSDPDWSPDGKQIVYIHDDTDYKKDPSNNVFSIYTIAPDGSNPTKLSSAKGFNLRTQMPTWSPRGKYIAYWLSTAVEGGFNINVAMINADGSRGLNLTRSDNLIEQLDFTLYERLSWSASGLNIVYSATVWVAPYEPAIFVADINGKTPVRVADGNYPVWQP